MDHLAHRKIVWHMYLLAMLYSLYCVLEYYRNYPFMVFSSYIWTLAAVLAGDLYLRHHMIVSSFQTKVEYDTSL